MNRELSIRITGEAGQGMQTIGIALCQLYKDNGLHVFACPDYMSRIRGGNNFIQVRVSDQPLHTLRQKADIIVALDKPSINIHTKNLTPSGVMILDKTKFAIVDNNQSFLDVPMYSMAAQVGGNELFVNSCAFGVVASLTGIDFKEVEKVLRSTFDKKEESIITKNIDVARAGYDFVLGKIKDKKFFLSPGSREKYLLMNGNEAIALGAIKAGVKFYSAYPMTPSTSIMTTVAHFALKHNIIVEQAEDEIAAINMAIGASFAGVRAMTGTSGGGFALMTEGVSLAGMTETPVVVVDSQRPAPATGFPTRTEQADLNLVLYAGHGEFARVIYAPGTIAEAFYLTIKAFDVAEKYQIPVFILTDQHLADCYRNIPAFDLNGIEIKRHIISKEESKNVRDYKRYQLTESGISPQAVPSWIEDVFYADSDEHTEEGHITEDAGVRTAMVEKRFHKKMEALKKQIEKPTAENIEKAEVVCLGFGSTYGVLKEASRAVKNKKIGFIHLSQVWPFPEKEIAGLLKNAKKILTVENNAGGQLAALLRQQTGIKVDGSILKFDGRPFDLDFLIEKLSKEI
ncbi:MAG TPA: 2-oxoacid:acceptor oxidoreductase subunit alpha [Candidatus Omnitrophota bacterium]|nr:2-oxoacid:acceptor oxidoreductase subunit alpha [Candidatus Omnitrophota bacterium]HPD84760.1 2-oxoacid:acceptor oxidoreductase subunit alpha [Candidatus Omnitrophota bacterium]HRZ03618.1 2-oxoacid:acceptor oxidoreductase subunit alpha [Candidatus Omnitrophota bacterium]